MAALRLINDFKQPRNIILLRYVDSKTKMVDPKMFKFGNIQHVVVLPIIRIDDAVWDNLASNN